MSMNIEIIATRKAWSVNKKGNKVPFNDVLMYPVVQTPTVVTRSIMSASDKKQAYIDYIMTQSRVESMPVYHEDDVFGEEPPI